MDKVCDLVIIWLCATGIVGEVWDRVTTLLWDTSSRVTGIVGENGVNFRRNLLFLIVTCLLPWIFTLYASWGRTSTTMADLFHLPGLPSDLDHLALLLCHQYQVGAGSSHHV